MIPLTLSLIFALLPTQAGTKPVLPETGVPQGSSPGNAPQDPHQATVPPGNPDSAGTATSKTSGTKNKGAAAQSKTPPADPWTTLKKKIDDRLAKDKIRLAKALQPYLSDLALDARDPKNHKYLMVRYGEIAALDPDIGLVLLPHIMPKSNNRRSRLIADNSMRVLEKTTLAPLEEDLMQIVRKNKGLSRNRALYLLTGFKKTGLDQTLVQLLTDSPEVYLPGVIVAVGRYGQSSMARSLVPFLQKPDEKQRKAAFEALCLLASADSLGSLVASAKASNKASDKNRLIEFLDTLGSRNSAEGWKKDEAVFFETLTWLLTQGEALRPQEIKTLLLLVQALPADAVQAKGGDKLLQALTRLLTNPYPDVQFGSALALRHLGDKKGVKQVLDRLTRFVRNNKKLAYAYRQRGRANEAFGDLSSAMRDYKQAINLSTGRVAPGLYIAVARLEAKKNNASNVYRYLKDARPTRQELAKFRADVPEVEALIRRSNQLRRLFEDS